MTRLLILTCLFGTISFDMLVSAQSPPQAARDVETSTTLSPRGMQVSAKNRNAIPIEALLLRVYSNAKSDGKPLGRGHFFLDRVASNGAEKAIAPNAAWTSPFLAASDEKTTVNPVLCAAIFADGSTTGDKECIADILNRRRSILIGSRTALASLDSAARNILSRSEVLAQLKELRAPLPWEVGHPVPGATNHPTLNAVREEIQRASDETLGGVMQRLREQLRAKISLLETARPPLD